MVSSRERRGAYRASAMSPALTSGSKTGGASSHRDPGDRYHEAEQERVPIRGEYRLLPRSVFCCRCMLCASGEQEKVPIDLSKAGETVSFPVKRTVRRGDGPAMALRHEAATRFAIHIQTGSAQTIDVAGQVSVTAAQKKVSRERRLSVSCRPLLHRVRLGGVDALNRAPIQNGLGASSSSRAPRVDWDRR